MKSQEQWFTVYREGVSQFTGTEAECYSWLQSHTSYSFHHAMTYEGWEIKPTGEAMAEEFVSALNMTTKGGGG